jgi:serine/threonine-protein kinase
MQIAAALGAAHAAGVVHRDIKPSNIIIIDRESDDGELVEAVKVLDFGVAKLQESLADQPKHMTIAMVSGTPEYMSPEHCNGHALDARSDLYALGCVLYFLLTGSPPFTGDGHLDVLMKQTREPVTPPSARRPDLPANLEAVVLKLLAKRPDDRYKTARAARAAFSKLHLPRTSDAGSFSVDLEGGDEVTGEGAALPAVSERKKQTLMLTPEELGRVRDSAPPRKRKGTRLMAGAVIVAIVIGVVAGLLFGQLYEPNGGPSEPPAAGQ